jgi:hypothetical protein
MDGDAVPVRAVFRRHAPRIRKGSLLVEQIHSSNLFRLYRALGGDTETSVTRDSPARS